MPNFTRPDLDEHEDNPQDWLASALIFTRALHFVLKENEGVVVNVKGEAKNIVQLEQVIVYRADNQIRIVKSELENVEEGQFIMYHQNDTQD